MVSSTSNDSQRQRERRQFYLINQRDDVWQHYVAPGPLPTNVEAHDFSKRGRHTCEEFVDRLDHTLPEFCTIVTKFCRPLPVVDA